MTFIVRDRDYDDCVSGINLDEVSSGSEETDVSSDSFDYSKHHGADGAKEGAGNLGNFIQACETRERKAKATELKNYRGFEEVDNGTVTQKMESLLALRTALRMDDDESFLAEQERKSKEKKKLASMSEEERMKYEEDEAKDIMSRIRERRIGQQKTIKNARIEEPDKIKKEKKKKTTNPGKTTEKKAAEKIVGRKAKKKVRKPKDKHEEAALVSVKVNKFVDDEEDLFAKQFKKEASPLPPTVVKEKTGEDVYAKQFSICNPWSVPQKPVDFEEKKSAETKNRKKKKPNKDKNN